MAPISPERLALLAKVLKATRPGSIPFCPQRPHPKQKQFLEVTAFEALFGGAAGPGKSSALLMAALQHVDQPKYDALIIRRTYKELSEPGAVMDRAKEWLIPQGVKWSDKDKRFSFKSGATLNFGYLDKSADVYQYAGAEYQFVGFDELTTFPKEWYTFLRSRVRKNKDNPVPLRMRATANPGGIGNAWVKARFVDPETAIGAFVPAKLSDNPSLDGDAYRAALEGLDPILRKQLLEGIWVQDSSGLVYPHFNDDPAKNGWPIEEPHLTQHMLGIDYGFVDECAFTVVGWREYDPNIYVVSSEKMDKMTPSGAAEHVALLEQQYSFAKIVADVGGLGKGYSEEARRRFGLPIEPAKKTNKRGYIDLFNGDMARGRIKVHPDCQSLIKEMAELPWNEDHSAEHPGFANHGTDSLLYIWRATSAFHNQPLPEPKAPDVVIHDQTEAFWKKISDENDGKSGSSWFDDKDW